MSFSVLGFAPPPINSRRKFAPCRNDAIFSCCSTSTSIENQDTSKKFTYSRALPSVRWPHIKFDANQHASKQKMLYSDVRKELKGDNEEECTEPEADEHEGELFDKRPSRVKVKRMNKLALKRAKDWRKRVQFLTDKILELDGDEFVADVLDKKMVQMTPTDFCFLVKWVGKSNWQRALEVYEWLNLRHRYAPNARMLATILAVLGKANQEALAIENFYRAEKAVRNNAHVYNAMMGVYARNGRFYKVQELLHLMRECGCEPDLVSFNILINARVKSGPVTLNLVTELLSEVRKAGLRPDIITYNTLISACSRDSSIDVADKILSDMKVNNCHPDLWTYNAIISVYARCGLSGEAVRLFVELESKGFFPDAVTYNSLLYAFAKEGNVEKVKEICRKMVEMGFTKNEVTYNTIIYMYAKQGKQKLALQVFEDMKASDQNPDAVTYTLLIDSLGKANKMAEAASLMSEMLNTGTRPTLRTYSALICGYAKAGQEAEAEEMFNCMIRAGIKPDSLAYSVILDMHMRSKNSKKAMLLYQEMVHDGYIPDVDMYGPLLQLLGDENSERFMQKVIRDLKEMHGLSTDMISSLLAKSGCYNFAAEVLRLDVRQSSSFNRENVMSIVTSYSLAGRHSEAIELLRYIQEHASGSQQLIAEALVIVYCKAHQLDTALDEYYRNDNLHIFKCSLPLYESLIKFCEEKDQFADASQIFSDMQFYGVEPSVDIYQAMALIYCRMDLPETAQHLLGQAETRGTPIHSSSVCAHLVETYGKLKELEKAEGVVGNLKRRCRILDCKVWNSMIQAYAANGCYEKARAAFNTMMRDGPLPTVDSINFLLKALIVEQRLYELYVVIHDLQDMGFKISKSSIILMLEAFAKSGNVPEVKKIYHGMKAAGYLPTMHLYRIMIGLLSRAKHVRDTEALVLEMEQAGFNPDLSIYNSLLKLYTQIEDYKKAAQVYQRLRESGLRPDEDTYNTLVLMYCRDRRPEEAGSLIQEMRQLSLNPHLDTCKSLIAALCKKMMIKEAEESFYGLKSEGHQLDRSFYHLMMKMYRISGNHAKAEELLVNMKESGIKPTVATIQLFMTSYASSGHPVEAEKILDNLKSSGISLSTLEYSFVIDAYLKNGDLDVGIQKLKEMIREGLDPDYRIWTCFVRAASLCYSISESTMLLTAIGDAGFDIPLRLLKENPLLVLREMDWYLTKLEPVEDHAAFNFVNALQDMLWAYERRATAAWIFQLAMKRSIYHRNIFRVSDNEWAADFKKLSAGAALIGLTLWLDQMQDASLEGFPASPKSVVLITGAELNSTLKAFLWETGSPFLPCKTRCGVLVAKAHSLRMWLKESPFCLDLELKDSPIVPETNSMQLIDGCYIRRGLVPAFNDIRESLGRVTPRKFSRLALLSDDKRQEAIQADIQGRREKLAKFGSVREENIGQSNNHKFTRRLTKRPSSPITRRPVVSAEGTAVLN